MEQRVAMVTGATGYVGELVARRLLDDGWTVRVLVRDSDGLDADLAKRLEVIEGDAESADDLGTAMHGADVAWFLIHSMGEGDDFAEAEQRMAKRFAEAARRAGVQRIVYLGGLHPEDEELSTHLASRVKVGEIFLASGVPTAALQAGVLMGDGSSSFDMLRALAQRLPLFGGPKWITNEIQPVDARDAVHYLVKAADLPAEVNRTFDIGGPDVLSYADMIRRYASEMGLGPRPYAVAPVMTPKLASYWMGLVTPIDSGLAAPLIASMLHDTVAKENDLDELVGAPEGGAMGFDESVRQAAKGHDQRVFAKVLAATAAAVTATAVLGTVATDPKSVWYRTRSKPSWQPPGAVFGPVWTALYADIAAISALHLTDAMERGDDDEVRAFSVALAANLALNAGWSWAFFRSHKLGLATGVAGALAISSADLVRRVGKRKERGVALAPYAAWTAFATLLSNELRRRN